MKTTRSSLSRVAFAWVAVGVTHAASVYQVSQSCNPSNFFDCFGFYTGADPTSGFVQYVDQGYASDNGLLRTSSSHIHLGADSTNTLSPSGPGRPSLRLESTFTQTHGLYILNLTHMPTGCGTWSAFWSLGPSWPAGGEIDIIEGANTVSKNLASLHTGDGCSIAGSGQSGTLLTNDCNVGSSNTGCGVQAASAASYGESFNSAGGGVYAMEWTSSAIRVWFFPRSTPIPRSITTGVPNPSHDFGTPMANFQGSCDIDSHFYDHKIVFDLTFCGDYAGNVYGSTSCPMTAGKSGYDSCIAHVANDPAAFEDAFWEIESLNVFQLHEVPAAPSHSRTSSTHTRLSSVKPVASKSPLSSHSLAMGGSTTRRKSSSLPGHRSSGRPRPLSATRTAWTRRSTYRGPNTPTPTSGPAASPSVGSRIMPETRPLPNFIASEPACGATLSIAATGAAVASPAASKAPAPASPAPVLQGPDGQVHAPVAQQADGQVHAPVVSQGPDGQVHAPVNAAAPTPVQTQSQSQAQAQAQAQIHYTYAIHCNTTLPFRNALALTTHKAAPTPIPIPTTIATPMPLVAAAAAAASSAILIPKGPKYPYAAANATNATHAQNHNLTHTTSLTQVAPRPARFAEIGEQKTASNFTSTFTFTTCIAYCDAHGDECAGVVFVNGTVDDSAGIDKPEDTAAGAGAGASSPPDRNIVGDTGARCVLYGSAPMSGLPLPPPGTGPEPQPRVTDTYLAVRVDSSNAASAPLRSVAGGEGDSIPVSDVGADVGTGTSTSTGGRTSVTLPAEAEAGGKTAVATTPPIATTTTVWVTQTVGAACTCAS